MKQIWFLGDQVSDRQMSKDVSLNFAVLAPLNPGQA
jgi:hypothetical protein